MRVAVLYGNISEKASKDELDVLVQVESIFRALNELGYETENIPFSFDFQKVTDSLRRIKPSFVFNLVESLDGHGRLIHFAPSILDCLNIPYTGANTEAMFITSNKLLTKKMLKLKGIATPDFITPEHLKTEDPVAQGPYIIKSVWEHGSVGIAEDSVIFTNNPEMLRREMDKRRDRLGGDCFAESYIEGREFNVSMLDGGRGNKPAVLPPAELCFENYPEGKLKIVDYKAKWETESFEYNHTPPNYNFAGQDKKIISNIKKIAKRCWMIFGLRGYGRVDFRLDQSGKPWVLEVNANPCLSPDSGFVAAAKHSGLDFPAVIEKIVEGSIPGLTNKINLQGTAQAV